MKSYIKRPLKKFRLSGFNSLYNYLIEQIAKISLGKVSKNYTFFTRNQAFSCENFNFFMVFLKMAKFGLITKLLYA